MDFEITDRVAVVTGGGQGLGRAYCHGLAAQRAKVVVADINEENARRVRDEITEKGGRALSAQVDVADEASVAALAERVTDELGSTSILVNNAAVFSTLTMKPMTEISSEEWDRVMAVNVRGAFLCIRALVPSMGSAGYGKIINVASSTIWIGRPLYLHYVTSKMALVGMTRALATELGPLGIRVNALTPGATFTEVQRETVTPAQMERIASRTALQRPEQPEDLIGTILFLSSPASDFITGQTINVDGGEAFH